MSTEKTELERMLEGRQAVEHGAVEKGDIVLYKSGSMEEAHPLQIGADVSIWAAYGNRVYRRIPVAKQGGDEQWRSSDAVRREKNGEPLSLDAQVAVKQFHVADATAPAQLAPRARTDDSSKPPLAWLPWEACNQMAMVQRYGQKKYGSFLNYRKGMEVSRNCSCAIRHIRDFMTGIDRDPESGESPLAHAMVRLAFIIENIKDGKAIDDRREGPSL